MLPTVDFLMVVIDCLYGINLLPFKWGVTEFHTIFGDMYIAFMAMIWYESARLMV